jgi:hypothetical protein
VILRRDENENENESVTIYYALIYPVKMTNILASVYNMFSGLTQPNTPEISSQEIPIIQEPTHTGGKSIHMLQQAGFLPRDLPKRTSRHSSELKRSDSQVKLRTRKQVKGTSI